ncbi:MAG: hypothetical protein AAFN78_04810 [Pseudomonadota bacterium]
MISRAILIATVCFALLPAGAHAARLFQPPLTELARGHITVIEGRAVEKTTDSVTFAALARFSGSDDAARVTVRMKEGALGDVTVGEPYIVGFTAVVSHPQRREEKLIDPDGPRVVTLRGFDTGALFPATDDVRALFLTIGAEQDEALRSSTVAALVRLLRSDDQRTRTLAAGELFLNEGLRVSIDADHAYRIGKATPTLSDELASYLVETLATLPEAHTAAWLPNVARELIGNTDVEYDLASHRPRLVSESVQALTPHVLACDQGRLEPLLRSNAPRVVKSSIAALERIDPALAETLVAETLDATEWDDSLTEPVRRILEAYRVTAAVLP